MKTNQTMEEERGTFSTVVEGSEGDNMCHLRVCKAQQGDSPHLDSQPMTGYKSGAIRSGVEVLAMPH